MSLLGENDDVNDFTTTLENVKFDWNKKVQLDSMLAIFLRDCGGIKLKFRNVNTLFNVVSLYGYHINKDVISDFDKIDSAVGDKAKNIIESSNYLTFEQRCSLVNLLLEPSTKQKLLEIKTYNESLKNKYVRNDGELNDELKNILGNRYRYDINTDCIPLTGEDYFYKIEDLIKAGYEKEKFKNLGGDIRY